MTTPTTAQEIREAHRKDLETIHNIMSEASRRWRVPRLYKMPTALDPELAVPLPGSPRPVVEPRSVGTEEEQAAEAQAAWENDLKLVNDYLLQRAKDVRFCKGFDDAINRINSEIQGPSMTTRAEARKDPAYVPDPVARQAAEAVRKFRFRR